MLKDYYGDEGHVPGRGKQRKFSDEQIAKRCSEWVKACDAGHQVPGWLTLVRWLDFYGREQLQEYMTYPACREPIKRAMLVVEEYYEKNLMGKSVIGSIFTLKNLGWSDKQGVDVKIGIGLGEAEVGTFKGSEDAVCDGQEADASNDSTEKAAPEEA